MDETAADPGRREVARSQDEIVDDLVAGDPARTEVVRVLRAARDAMSLNPDRRWSPVAALLDDASVRVADLEYRVDAGWLERNYRQALSVARGYLAGAEPRTTSQ